jgi:hypothetical protein
LPAVRPGTFNRLAGKGVLAALEAPPEPFPGLIWLLLPVKPDIIPDLLKHGPDSGYSAGLLRAFQQGKKQRSERPESPVFRPRGTGRDADAKLAQTQENGPTKAGASRG